MKPTRHVDLELLAQVRLLPCLACAARDPEAARAAVGDKSNETHPHHLKTRGSGGGDVDRNLLPLCFHHHRQIHQKGISYMNHKYPTIAAWLSLAGWQWDPLIGWHNEDL